MLSEKETQLWQNLWSEQVTKKCAKNWQKGLGLAMVKTCRWRLTSIPDCEMLNVLHKNPNQQLWPLTYKSKALCYYWSLEINRADGNSSNGERQFSLK